MKASTLWLNDYLAPPAPSEEQGEILTMAGFPVEGREEVALADGTTDVRTEYEMTSNRGDCICHIGLAREIAAASNRSLKLPLPSFRAEGPDVSETIHVANHEKVQCPLYTARIIRGVHVGSSPAWLADRLRAIGQIPRNNIVDATNFVLFEYGQPTHVFDLSKLDGGVINIRRAKDGEAFLPIGEGSTEIKLTTDDLVIADGSAPVALAGVKGGALSAVTMQTTDLLIEAATFNPLTVRNSSRRHRITSDSAYRYERGVTASHVEPAAHRLVELILQVAGGTLDEGVASDGAPVAAPLVVTMRPTRCRSLLGVELETDRILESLDRLGFQPEPNGDVIACTVPAHRVDIEREVDLIEEVGRMYGLANIPVGDTIDVRVAPPQPRISARHAVRSTLVGMEYLETITHTLLSEKEAQPFLRANESLMRVDRDRAPAEPCLRPSIVPSLLRVRALNEHRGVGEVRLFESGAVCAWTGTSHRESRVLTLLQDIKDMELGLRPLRGVIERLIGLLRGVTGGLTITTSETFPWCRADAQATIALDGQPIGWLGVMNASIRKIFDLEPEMMAAELELEPLYATWPPQREIHALPSFPAIERDLSAIVDERTTWSEIHHAIEQLNLDKLEAIAFVTTYRGKQIEQGKKSLTLRLRFRASERTLTHDEVDPQVDDAMRVLEESFNASIRR